MYPGPHAEARADQPAVIMADSGETITYRELEARSNRLARLLRAVGLCRLDHYAIFMENHPRYIECCAAGERSGLYYTAINSFLTAGELAYIVNNSLSRVLITSEAKRDVALAALADCPAIELCLLVDGPSEGERVRNLDDATAEFPATPIADETLGAAMLYSSGTTGRPKGVLRPLPDQPPAQCCTSAIAPSGMLAISRGPDLPLACASLPRGALGRRLCDDPLRRDGRGHGAIRPGTIPGACREIQHHPHPARADDVLADAEAARRHAPGL